MVNPWPAVCSGGCCCWARRCFFLADCRHIVIISAQASIFGTHLGGGSLQLSAEWGTAAWRRGALQLRPWRGGWAVRWRLEERRNFLAALLRRICSSSCWRNRDWLLLNCIFAASGTQTGQKQELHTQQIRAKNEGFFNGLGLFCYLRVANTPLILLAVKFTRHSNTDTLLYV